MQMGTIQAADVEFYVSNTKRMWLEGSNNGIYFVGPPVPETDGGVNLGDTSIRWATTWTDNITTSGHVGIGTGFDGTWALKVEDADRWAASFSTTSSGAAGPTVALYLNSSSPADGDHCGYLTWYGNNSTPTSISYGYMFVNTGDVTAGTEDANWYIYLYSGGSLNLASYITGPGQVNGDLAYNEFDEWDDRDQLELAVKDPARVDLRIQDALFTWHPDHIGHDGKMRPMLNYSVAFNFLAGGVYQNRDHIVEVERRMDGLWEEAHQARQWQEDYGVKVIDIADRLETQEQKVERLQKENAESSEREAELTKRVAELERLAA
jgi:hypothetical protein